MVEIQTQVMEVTHRGEQFTIYGYPGDHISEMMRPGRFYEADMLDFILTQYGTGGVYYDFGAFIGTHTLFFSRLCKADLVVAAEVNPMTLHYLSINIMANKCENVEVYACAVGKENGRTKLYKTGSNEGTYACVPVDRAEVKDTLPMIRSGNLITAPPKLIKIDVEGSHLDVLYGCRDEIREFKPILVVEAAFGDEFNSLENIMSTWLNYELVGTFNASPTHIWRPIE